MKVTGRCTGLTKDFGTGKYNITLEINEPDKVTEEYDRIKGISVLDIEIKKHRKKRSLDANAYSWVLLTKIADVIHSSKEEVYESKLIDYGQPLLDKNGPVTVSLPEDVNPAILGLHLKYEGTKYDLNTSTAVYKVYRGQSDYNTQEMSIFIDGLVQDAKELGIETLTPDGLERMKAAWKA